MKDATQKHIGSWVIINEENQILSEGSNIATGNITFSEDPDKALYLLNAIAKSLLSKAEFSQCCIVDISRLNFTDRDSSKPQSYISQSSDTKLVV